MDQISSNQVISVPITFECITPDCKNLNGVLKAIDSKLCEQADLELNYNNLSSACVDSADNLQDLLQNIIGAIPCPRGEGGSTPVPDTTINGLMACATDGWSCSRPDACFNFTNECDPGNVTLKIVLQALIDRNVAYGNVITNLCARISTLEADVAALQLTVSQIQESCCA